MGETDIATLREMFRQAPFIAELGLELESIGPGECVTTLDLQPRHLQQNGFVHAGVQATLADHTEVFSVSAAVERLAAKASATMAVLVHDIRRAVENGG